MRVRQFKKTCGMILAVCSLAFMASCQPASEKASVDLHIFAAASLTEALLEIAETYRDDNPDVLLTFTFDSSGTLRTQIAEGADGDIFVSAAQKQMDQLDISSERNMAGLDLIVHETRINLLGNTVVLVVPDGNPAGISCFMDLADNRVELIALGNSDVPVGQYAEDILRTMGLWEEIQGRATLGSNVKEVAAWVGESVVDCGMVYRTDAIAAALQVVAAADPGMLAEPIVYPAAILRSCQEVAAAQSFLAYLQGADCTAIFSQYGFSRPE